MAAPNIYTKEEIRERRRKANEARRQRFRDQYGIKTQNQMQALSIKGMHAWLLQGPTLVKVSVHQPCQLTTKDGAFFPEKVF